MRSSDLSQATWRKSRRGNCVEVAGLPDRVAMRDSKDPAGPVLMLARAQWQAFLSSVRAGDLS